MTHTLRFLLATAAVAGLTGLGCARAEAAEARTLRFGIGLSADSPKGAAVVDFGNRLAAYSNGTLRVELLAGGKAGNDVTMVKALQEGTLEMTAPDTSTLASMEKGFSAINYPFTFLNEREADAILDGAWGQKLLDRLPQHGVIGLSYWENGFRHMTNSRKPIAAAADFDGVRMRTMQNPMLVDSFNKLGFTAVPLPFTQVYDALRSQSVDGQENPLSTILSSRFYEVQKYLTLSRHVYSVHLVLVSGKVWQSLTPAEQAAMTKASVEARDFGRRLNRNADEQALAELKTKGMSISTIPRADAERIRNRLRAIFEKYNSDIGVGTMIELYVELGRMRTEKANAPAPRLEAQSSPAAKAAPSAESKRNAAGRP
jgi:tripartite ATP-independent transporter DctP family solute receptor